MPSVILEGTIEFSGDTLAMVEAELPHHIELTRREKGCLMFKVTKDPNSPSRYRVYEQFDSRQAFAAHQRRVKSSRWGKFTQNARRDYQVRREVAD